jgi:hypothetical protein
MSFLLSNSMLQPECYRQLFKQPLFSEKTKISVNLHADVASYACPPLASSLWRMTAIEIRPDLSVKFVDLLEEC